MGLTLQLVERPLQRPASGPFTIVFDATDSRPTVTGTVVPTLP